MYSLLRLPRWRRLLRQWCICRLQHRSCMRRRLRRARRPGRASAAAPCDATPRAAASCRGEAGAEGLRDAQRTTLSALAEGVSVVQREPAAVERPARHPSRLAASGGKGLILAISIWILFKP